MRLFEIDPDTSTVSLNKPWIMLIPEFAELFKRDKGSEGDYRGDKKLRTRKELTFIYFYLDFASPITDWEDDERWTEALYYANMTQDDIDAKVIAAKNKYDELQLKGARALRTYRSLLRAQDAMDAYYENLNFTEKDKKGELLNNPLSVANSIEKLDKMYVSITNFRKRVEIELKDASTGIRGTAVLGDNEGKASSFSEQDIMDGSNHAGGPSSTGGTFDKMLSTLNTMSTKVITQEELDKVEDDKE